MQIPAKDFVGTLTRKNHFVTGIPYGAAQQVNQDSGNAIQGRLKELGSTGTAVYVVWADNVSGNYDVYLNRLV